MKIVVAPDSFKGSLAQVEVAQIIKQGIMETEPGHEIVSKPMADGGEGTLDALVSASSESKLVPLPVVGALGKEILTNIGIIHDDTAVIEIASIAGLPLVPENLRNPYQTTTYGIGQAILYALNAGIRKFIIGLGGSATNDGGFGMLMALGAEITDSGGRQIGIFGNDLGMIQKVNLETLDPRIYESVFQIASDVDNPLYGKNGATYVFGPQKGATPKQISLLDQALQNYSMMLEKSSSELVDLANTPGAGAAGGLGYAFLAIGGELVSGAKLIADTTRLEADIHHADLVITGEGKSDEQTLYGKAPGYVAELATKHNVPVVLISGSLSDETQILHKHFTACYQVKDDSLTLKQAMSEAKVLLLNRVKQVIAKHLS